MESWLDWPPTVTLVESVAVCAGVEESETWSVNDEVPFADGIPLIWPVVELSVRPGGNEPAEIDQVYGVVPPVADG